MTARGVLAAALCCLPAFAFADPGASEEELAESLVDADLVPESREVALDESLELDLTLTNNSPADIEIGSRPVSIRLFALDSAGRPATIEPALPPNFLAQLRDRPVRIAPGGKLEIPLQISPEALRRAGVRAGGYSLSVVITTPIETGVQGVRPGARWNGEARTSARLEFRGKAAPTPSPTATRR